MTLLCLKFKYNYPRVCTPVVKYMFNMAEREGGFRKNVETGARMGGSAILFVGALAAIGAGSLALAAVEGAASYFLWPKSPSK